MKEEMRVLYAEGLASHGGPQPCVDVPRGRGEALAWARAGRAIEPRNHRSGVPTLSERRKATPLAALCASRQGAPRGPGTRACAEPSCARTGRSRVSPVWVVTGRAVQGTLRR